MPSQKLSARLSIAARAMPGVVERLDVAADDHRHGSPRAGEVARCERCRDGQDMVMKATLGEARKGQKRKADPGKIAEPEPDQCRRDPRRAEREAGDKQERHGAKRAPAREGGGGIIPVPLAPSDDAGERADRMADTAVKRIWPADRGIEDECRQRDGFSHRRAPDRAGRGLVRPWASPSEASAARSRTGVPGCPRARAVRISLAASAVSTSRNSGQSPEAARPCRASTMSRSSAVLARSVLVAAIHSRSRYAAVPIAIAGVETGQLPKWPCSTDNCGAGAATKPSRRPARPKNFPNDRNTITGSSSSSNGRMPAPGTASTKASSTTSQPPWRRSIRATASRRAGGRIRPSGLFGFARMMVPPSAASASRSARAIALEPASMAAWVRYAGATWR